MSAGSAHVRLPAVAGRFYPASPTRLREQVHELLARAAGAIERRSEPLLDLDAEGLYRTVVHREISMCGVVPATAMLAYARTARAAAAELVSYATSGDAFGDLSRVVGYAGVVVR